MNTRVMTKIVVPFLSLVICVACSDKKNNHTQLIRKEIVNQILKARSMHSFIDPVSKSYSELNLEEAYAVQSLLSAELSKLYGPVAGYKLGYADSISLKKNAINTPAYGPIFRNQIKPSPAVISADEYQNLSIELEIVFKIAKMIDHNVNSIDELIPYIKSVHVGFDISNGIFNGQTNIIDFVASGGGSQSFIVGAGMDPVETDVSNLRLSIRWNGQNIYEGLSSKVLGNPWLALKALSNDLVRCHRPLKADDVVFSGKVAPSYTLPSEEVQGTYTGMASPFNDIQVIID